MMDIKRRMKNQEKVQSTLGLLKTSVVYQGKEFFNNSTLHGVRYIVNQYHKLIQTVYLILKEAFKHRMENIYIRSIQRLYYHKADDF